MQSQVHGVNLLYMVLFKVTALKKPQVIIKTNGPRHKADAMTYDFSTTSVLIVEDNKPMLNLVHSLLEAFGISELYTAENGDQGFEAFCRKNPDIVIADWMMTPTNGIELTRIIRSHKDSPNPFVPVILITAYSERQRVTEARDSGVTEFLIKPFTANNLYRRIVQVIEKPRQFVITDDYFGPDRRRHKPDPNYQGPLRRSTDRLASSAKEQKEDYWVIDPKQKADKENQDEEQEQIMRDPNTGLPYKYE